MSNATLDPQGQRLHRPNFNWIKGKHYLWLIILIWSVALFANPAHAVIVFVTPNGATSGANDALPTNGTAGALVINKPAGALPGHALIASIAARPSNMTVTVPPNWFLMTTTQQPAGGPSTLPGGMTLLTYYHIVTLTEPASYTWTFANTAGSGPNYGGSAVGGILAFSGIDTSASPINVWSARLTASGLTHATNSITPTVTNSMIVSSISYLSGSDFANPTGIAGLTERLDQRAPAIANAIGTTLQMSTVPWAPASATGASQAVASGDADTGVGHLMALKPSLVDPSITKTRSGPLNPGGSASYTLTVTNLGLNPEPGPLSVVDTLPTGLTYNPAGSGGSGWGCSAAGQTVTCTRAGALAGGATAAALTINVNVSAAASGTLTNSATVSGTGGDGNMFNNTATDSYTFTPDLALSMSSSALNPGQNGTFTLDVSNVGTATEPGPITITDTLPANLTFVSGSGAGWSCSAAGQTVTCTRTGALNYGATAASLILTVAVAQNATTITNSATVSASGPDSNAANNTDSVTYNISADLSITKIRSAALVPGTNATYTLNVSNAGANAAPQPITITDTLPAGLTYVSGVGTGWSCSAAGQAVTCTRSSALASGASTSVTLTVAVNAGASGTITNTATVSGTATDSNAANNSATDSYTIVLATYAYYKMDETSWSGVAGEVKDASGNNRNANALGGISTLLTPAASPKGDTCRGTNITDNNSVAIVDAVDTGIDINSLGTAGTISFWYRSRLAWNSGGGNPDDRVLFDATNNAGNGEFWMVLQDNGQIRFRLDNAGDNRQTEDTATINRVAGTWVHVAATWNFTTNTMCVYVDGVSAGCTTSANITSTPNYSTLYIGDTRGTFTNNVNRGNSADGDIDEVRIYAAALTAAQIATDMNATHSCVVLDHYELSLATNSITCLPTTATVTACADNSNPCTNPYVLVSGQTADLTTTGGTLAVTTVTFNAAGVATTTLNYPAAPDNTTVSVTLSGEDIPAVNARKCCPNGVNCVVRDFCSTTFNTTGFIFSNSVGGSTTTIPTQTAGIASGTYYLRAVKTQDNSSHTCGAAFSGLQSVNFAYECNNPATCYGANLMSVNGGTATTIPRNNNGSVTTYTPVSMTFDANGNAPFTFLYSDVGQVKLWTSKTTANTATLIGSSNPFVVKPFDFVLSNIMQTAAPNLVNPGAINAAGAKFVKAGESFSATVTARTATGSTAFSYGREAAPGTETVKLTPTLVAPLDCDGVPANDPDCQNPIIGGTFNAFTNGVATGTNFNWGEVGIITLTPSVGDGSYLGVGDVTGTITGNVGRFYPDHFALSAPELLDRSDFTCAPVSTFTYMSEPFRLRFTLTAQNLANGTTQNYATINSFAKLDGTATANWTAFGVNGSMGLGAIDNPGALSPANRIPLTARVSVGAVPSAPTGPWTSGVGLFTAHVSLNRAAAPPLVDGPFNFLNLGIAPQDTDGVTLVPATLNLDADKSGTNERAIVANTVIRYGRLNLNNGHGSELLPLPLTFTAQFWNGGFVTNTDDSCTQVPVPTVANGGLVFFPASTKNQLNTPETTASINGTNAGNGTFIAGNGGFQLTRPGPGNFGFLDVLINAPDYLRFNWNNALAGDENPQARATFGVYKNANQFIYMRELY